MVFPFCDWHTHTQRSDGRLTPLQLVRKAYAAGIRVMSITDHNYTEVLTNLRRIIADEFAEEMVLVQGAEISALYTDGKGVEHELHIVALGFDPNNPDIKELLAAHQPDRKPYIDAILKKLKEDCGGIDLGTYESIQAQFPTTKYIGRMVLARLLFEKGYTSSVDESFDIFLGSHGERRAYIKNPLRYADLDTVVRTIIKAGGIPILAHLLYYDLDDGNRTGGVEKELLVRTFKELVTAYGGTGGMEVYYTRYKDVNERLYLLRLAQKYNLLISGGSDYHEQESWESLNHRLSCSACQDLLNHLGIKVNYPLPPAPLHVLSGFSGVGKGTIAAKVEGRWIGGKPVALIQSYTSRAPRSENDSYTFVTREAFAAMAEANKFLEYNDGYSNHSYGTPVDSVRTAIESNKAILLEIDRTGLIRLLTDGKINPKLVRSVFVVANAAVDVATRLYLRGTESQAQIKRRLEAAIQESYYLNLYDAVIVNDIVEDAVDAVIDAFEGNPPENTFDPVRFRTEMEEVLTTYWRTPKGLLYDPVEDTAGYQEAMTQINKQLANEFSREETEAINCPAVWLRKKELLKTQGIHWRTPSEMNPDHSFA